MGYLYRSLGFRNFGMYDSGYKKPFWGLGAFRSLGVQGLEVSFSGVRAWAEC